MEFNRRGRPEQRTHALEFAPRSCKRCGIHACNRGTTLGIDTWFYGSEINGAYGWDVVAFVVRKSMRPLPNFAEQKVSRRSIQYPVWIIVKDVTIPLRCLLSDVSEGGARLSVEAGETLPDEFILSLTEHQSRGRRCRVVAREKLYVDIRFIERLMRVGSRDHVAIDC
jgi:hypothetical protein